MIFSTETRYCIKEKILPQVPENFAYPIKNEHETQWIKARFVNQVWMSSSVAFDPKTAYRYWDFYAPRVRTIVNENKGPYAEIWEFWVTLESLYGTTAQTHALITMSTCTTVVTRRPLSISDLRSSVKFCNWLKEYGDHFIPRRKQVWRLCTLQMHSYWG